MARVDPKNSTQYWWDRHLTGLSLLRADFTTHEYPPHTHEALVVAVTEQGGSLIKSRGQVEEAHAATLFVFNPAEPHAGWMAGASAGAIARSTSHKPRSIKWRPDWASSRCRTSPATCSATAT